MSLPSASAPASTAACSAGRRCCSWNAPTAHLPSTCPRTGAPCHQASRRSASASIRSSSLGRMRRTWNWRRRLERSSRPGTMSLATKKRTRARRPSS
eukprot:3310893-Prymnesium_polylepis.1